MMKEYILRIDEYADLSDLSIDDENIVWVNWHYPNGLGESTPEGTIRPYPSPWRTGTPTEEGWYVVAYECVYECRNKGKLEYHTMHILEDEFGYKDIRGRASDDVWKAVAWQKIEPYKEAER